MARYALVFTDASDQSAASVLNGIQLVIVCGFQSNSRKDYRDVTTSIYCTV